MAIDRIHLRKLLMLMFLPDSRRRSEFRKDIRGDLAQEAGMEGAGGDFYVPFWADARAHVFGTTDLHASVQIRIDANHRRQALYPQLRDGFLVWWNERRRWTNEPFQLGRSIKSQYVFADPVATVKVDNILSVRDAQDVEHYIYPYFSPEPILSDEAARLGLWLLITALPDLPAEEIRILDVIRGRTYSVDRVPLIGDEEQSFRRRYQELLDEWEALREEYG
jgi:hypothetical protein